MKEEGRLPFGQLPALGVTIGGVEHIISQSATIMRFVGKKAGPEIGLYPSDDVLAAKVGKSTSRCSGVL